MGRERARAASAGLHIAMTWLVLAVASVSAFVATPAEGHAAGATSSSQHSFPEPPSARARKAVAPGLGYQWSNVKIVGSGYVTGIVFNPGTPGLAFARTDMGGAYRWNSSTRTWTPITDWLGRANNNLLGIESIATDPVNSSRVYLAAGTYARSWSGDGALLRSTNRGRSFQTIPLPFQLGANEPGRQAGERLSIDPNNDATLYLGTRNNGLWRSRDFGSTWSQVASFPIAGPTDGVGVDSVVFDRSSGTAGSGSNTIYVDVSTDETNLYRTVDAGKSWQAVSGAPSGQYSDHTVLSADGNLYLTYNNAIGPTGITAGSVWRLSTATGEWTNISPTQDSYGWGGIDVDAEHPHTLMVATFDKYYPSAEVYRSLDDGATWTPLLATAKFDTTVAPYLGTVGHWMGTLAIDPFNSDHVMYGSGNGVYGTYNATTADSGRPTLWSVEAVGIEQSAVHDLIDPPGGSLISAIADVGGFRHTNLQTTHLRMTNPNIINTSLDFAQKVPTDLVRVGDGAAIAGGYSTNGGATWAPFGSAPVAAAKDGSVALSSDGRSVLWVPTGTTGYYTTDDGTTWGQISGLPENAQPVADRNKSGTFYAETPGGFLYRSTNEGESFELETTGLQDGQLKSTSFADGDLWLSAGRSGLFHSSDNGISFQKITGGVTTAYGIGFGKPRSAKQYPTLFLSGVVAGVSGVFRSTNEGESWSRINDNSHQYGGFGSLIIGDPNVFGKVYLGTDGRGIVYGTSRN